MIEISTLKRNGIYFIRVKDSPEIRLVCPNCKNLAVKNWDDPKLYINIFKEKADCKRCGWRSSKKREILSLLRLRNTENIEVNFDSPIKKKTKKIVPIPYEAVPADKSKKAREYLKSRNIGDELIQKFALLYCARGFYENRIIIPVFNWRGEYRSFISRSILKNPEKKYLNPKGFRTSEFLYNLHFMKGKKSLTLVEGVFDAIHLYPFIPAVASFGKEVHEAQINSLRIMGIERIFLMFDHEAWFNTPKIWEKNISKLSKYFFCTQIKLPYDTPTEFSIEELQSFLDKAY